MAVSQREPGSVTEVAGEVEVKVVDTDVHPQHTGLLPHIIEYIPEPWRSRYHKRFLAEAEGSPSVYPPITGTRTDAAPPSGVGVGNDPEFLAKQLFQDARVDYAILGFMTPMPKLTNPELDGALCSALNAWAVDTWLGSYNWHERFWGSIRVSMSDPDNAVREIELWAEHPKMVEVYVFPESSTSFGQPQYRPILEAAARHNLPVAIHPRKAPGMYMLSPTGFASYHVENFTQWPMAFMAHAASLIFEGVFDELPNLKIACIEGGFSWALPLMWRLDRQWEALRCEVPNVKRRPSEYLREHFRFATQPLEEPKPHANLLKAMELIHGGEVLMFSTDYPHYDFENPGWIYGRLDRAYRDRIMAGNAIDLYKLPTIRRVDRYDEEGTR